MHWRESLPKQARSRTVCGLRRVSCPLAPDLFSGSARALRQDHRLRHAIKCPRQESPARSTAPSDGPRHVRLAAGRRLVKWLSLTGVADWIEADSPARIHSRRRQSAEDERVRKPGTVEPLRLMLAVALDTGRNGMREVLRLAGGHPEKVRNHGLVPSVRQGKPFYAAGQALLCSRASLLNSRMNADIGTLREPFSRIGFVFRQLLALLSCFSRVSRLLFFPDTVWLPPTSVSTGTSAPLPSASLGSAFPLRHAH